MLEPGEAVVLILRRSEFDPSRYFVAVRGAGVTPFDRVHDIQIGPYQIPAHELENTLDVSGTVKKATQAFKEFLL
jgi:hypothetical protein